ncbi:MAG: EutN/CcmL family microcompartment protein [Candidatus Aureabacteria bacterium]|nr:EutN/CcmL family microcompartment protein [Candidatus Auribacterota bacterium]
MQLGIVMGTVVSTNKSENIQGLKLLLVQQLSHTNKQLNNYVVAVDVVQAGIGDVVLYSEGSSCRQTQLTDKRPVDGVVMAVVDTWEVGGKEIYNKSQADTLQK